MHVEIHPKLQQSPGAREAGDLIGACVHCGFCLATCPTYLDSGDERDSPRGRIYLVKQLLEEGDASSVTHTHLDRCLTCRSCETTCPSGMQYGALLDLGRGMMEQVSPRPLPQRIVRSLLRNVLSRPALFAALLKAGQLLRPLLPTALARKIPPRQSPARLPDVPQARNMLVLSGCVQGAATPATNVAAARLLDRAGITLRPAPAAGCCGAVNYHLGAHTPGLDNMRRNIDAWWPLIEDGAEAIVSSATGCGSMLADYGKALAGDPVYAERAARVSALHRDIAEIITEELPGRLSFRPAAKRVAVHVPCSQQHALGQGSVVGDLLREAGFELAATADDHLCCGSAGTYSILQPERSNRLRTKKIAALSGDAPQVIVTANVGCQLHLGQVSDVPVRHWIELLDEACDSGN